jgi:hypothetical protein
MVRNKGYFIIKGDWHTAYVLFYGPRRLEEKYLNAKPSTESAVSNASNEIKTESANTN